MPILQQSIHRNPSTVNAVCGEGGESDWSMKLAVDGVQGPACETEEDGVCGDKIGEYICEDDVGEG